MIVGNSAPAVREHLRAHRERLAEEVERKDARLRELGARKYLDGQKK
jgi:hypothetical protein